MITFFLVRILNEKCLVVYVLAALWGVADAIWQTQINALYGVLFAKNEEAAFSNYRLWESLGFLFAFLTQVRQYCSLCGIKISKETHVFLCLGNGSIRHHPLASNVILSLYLPHMKINFLALF